MNFETLKTSYPKLFSKLPQEVDTLRSLIIIDENYEDPMFSDEPTDLESDEYNYMVYITPELQSVLEENGLQKLAESLERQEGFDDFYPSEEDLYGIHTQLDRDGIAGVVLGAVEEMIA